jgi:hypothetical protein
MNDDKNEWPDKTPCSARAAWPRYRSDVTDEGCWYVVDVETGRKINVGDRPGCSFVLAEIFEDGDPAAAFDRILSELGEMPEVPR